MLNVEMKLINSLCCLSIIGLLAGCGGSGTTNGGCGLTCFATIKTYPSGTLVLTAEDTDAVSNPQNAVAAHENIAAVKEIWDETATSELTITSNDGVFFTITETGASTTGQTFENAYSGYFLDADQVDFVSMAEGTIDGDYGVISGGAKMTGVPSGTFTYQGKSIIATEGSTQGFIVLNNESGTSSMTANFSNNTGSLQTNTSTYSYNENNIVINPSDGSFSGSTGTIGVTGGTTETANVKGYFSGTNAAGMHGVAYSAGNEDTFVSTFIGTKQ